MNEDLLRRQAIFRMVVFVLLMMTIGFIAGDLNMLDGGN